MTGVRRSGYRHQRISGKTRKGPSLWAKQPEHPLWRAWESPLSEGTGGPVQPQGQRGVTTENPGKGAARPGSRDSGTHAEAPREAEGRWFSPPRSASSGEAGHASGGVGQWRPAGGRGGPAAALSTRPDAQQVGRTEAFPSDMGWGRGETGNPARGEESGRLPGLSLGFPEDRAELRCVRRRRCVRCTFRHVPGSVMSEFKNNGHRVLKIR